MPSQETPTMTLADAQHVTVGKLAEFYLKCKDAYFNSDTPLVDDTTFDALEDILRHRSPNHSALHVVGAHKTSDDKVKLPYWMGSQDKIYPGDTKAFQKWKARVGNHVVVASAKLDGLSGIFIVEQSAVHLLSRGDGQYAKDWTHHVQHMPQLLQSALTLQKWMRAHNTSRVVLRGEAIMSKKHFNRLRTKLGWTSTARNIVSGLLNAKKSNADVLKCVDVVFYEVVEPLMSSFQQQLDFLQRHTFYNVAHSLGVPCNAKTLSHTFTMADLEPLFYTYREQCPYETDGVVIQSNTVHTRNTKANPKYAFAFKIRVNDASQTAQTVVKDVVWNVSRHGYLIPTILLEPVVIANVNIQKTTGFHYKFIVDNKIGKGTVVQLRRCGDVIPNVVGVVHSTKAILPSVPYTLTPTGVDALIQDPSHVDAYVIEQMTHFFKVMDVPHVSEKTIQKCVEHGYRDVFDVLTLDVDTLLQWEGFSHTSSKQFVDNVRVFTMKANVTQWIHGGNVFGRGIGKRHIQTLLKHAPALFTISPLTKKKRDELRSHLLTLNGYQHKTISVLLDNHHRFVSYWEKVKKHMGKNTPSLPSESTTTPTHSLDLDGAVFCFSGVRDKTLQHALEARGALFVSGVSKKVNVLICKSLSISSDKLKKARELQALGNNIRILTLEETKQMFTVQRD